MKIQFLFFLSLISLVTISCGPKELPTSVVMNDEFIEVKLSHQTTKDEMLKIQSDAKAKYNLNFDFSKSSFFDDGKLRTLNLAVVSEAGSKGTTTADLMTLQNKYFGFMINLDPNAGTSMKIGTM